MPVIPTKRMQIIMEMEIELECIIINCSPEKFEKMTSSTERDIRTQGV